jgi:hypothetical protein
MSYRVNYPADNILLSLPETFTEAFKLLSEVAPRTGVGWEYREISFTNPYTNYTYGLRSNHNDSRFWIVKFGSVYQVLEEHIKDYGSINLVFNSWVKLCLTP